MSLTLLRCLAVQRTHYCCCQAGHLLLLPNPWPPCPFLDHQHATLSC